MTQPLAPLTAHLTRAGEGELFAADPTGTITMLAEPADTGGTLSAHRSTFAEGSTGAPPHFHTKSSELFYVLGGRLQVLLDEEVRTLEAGDLLVVPAFMPHAFAPPAGASADVLFTFTPGVSRRDYYNLLDRVHAGDAGWDEVGATQDLYDNHYVQSPAWEGR